MGIKFFVGPQASPKTSRRRRPKLSKLWCAPESDGKLNARFFDQVSSQTCSWRRAGCFNITPREPLVSPLACHSNMRCREGAWHRPWQPRAFNQYSLPIVIQAIRAALPTILTQAEDTVKGLRLHVDSDFAESGSDHVETLIELDNLCKGIAIYAKKRS